MTDNNTSNLTVVASELEPCRMKVDIEVPAERVREQYDKVLKSYQEKAQLPGFRAGKSPHKLLERKYRSQALGETLNKLVDQCTREALQQEELQPETQPQIENEEKLSLTDPDQALVYSITFEVAPSVEPPDIEKLTIQRRPSTVNDEAVESFVTQLLEQRAAFETVERPAEEGDMLRVDFHGVVRDADAEELPETARFLLDEDDTTLPLREPEMLPGATEQLLGCEAGETVNIDIMFPESFVETSLAGKVADYTVTIHEVQAQISPELNDETAKSHFGVESAQKVRDTARQYLQQQEEQTRQQGLREDLLEKLTEGQDFALPPGLLARESYDMYQSQMQRLAQQNPQQVQQEEFQKQLWEQAQEKARQRLRRRYVLRRIADQLNIQLDNQEIERTFEQMAKTYEMPVKEFKKRLRDSGRLADVIMDLRESKTISHLLHTVTIEEPEEAESIPAEDE